MKQQLINFIGTIAATLTTIAFIPQVIAIIKSKRTKDISLTMYILLFTGLFLWLVYGIAINSLPLIGSNSITSTLVLIILFYKLKYG
jgi:MtN3 and saliva related transmembrane protein